MADSHGSNSRNYYNNSNQKNLNHSPFVLFLLKTKSKFFFNTYLMNVLKYKLSPNLSLYKFEDIVIFLFIKILIKKKFKKFKGKKNIWLDHESNP